MSSKRYPEEFKIEAVKQITERGYPVSEVSKRLDVTTHSLYAWVKKYGPDKDQHQAKADEQAELKRLRKELARVTEERDLLKKAAAYFARESDWGMPLFETMQKDNPSDDYVRCLMFIPAVITLGWINRHRKAKSVISGRSDW